jgi:crotonobetainyl-CoA:carnitine CoA-transferase CaiB-like acyl-CoA transferase
VRPPAQAPGKITDQVRSTEVASESGTALARLRVLDLTGTLAGAYCTKLLADGGADVVKAEPASGDPLRRRMPEGVTDQGAGALFGYLSRGKESIAPDQTGRSVTALARLADLVVMDGSQPAAEDAARSVLASRDDSIGVVISPFGLDGPWAGRAASDLLLQALSSSIAGRGEKTGTPVAAGGNLIEWAAGVTAAVAALIALRQRSRDGTAGTRELIDVSLLEAAVMIFNGFRGVSGQLAPPPSPPRVVEVPSVEPSGDGWVGFCALSAQQFAAFAEMIGEPDWATHPDFSRIDRRCELAAVIRPRIAAWTRNRTTGEIMEEGGRRRVPVAPVGNGQTAPAISHLAERHVFRGDLASQPRIPYRFSRTPQPEFGAVPRLGEHAQAAVLERWAQGPAAAGAADDGAADDGAADDGAADDGAAAAGGAAARPAGSRPLAGVRVFDMTSFWAGPMVGQILGAFGADVIKVESVQRPDGTRLATSYGMTGERLWERAPLYQAVNTNKRNLTLDLTAADGRELARRLLTRCDVLIENYVPNVAERFGILDDLDPATVVVRMPAWGLSGPWRDRAGFAQTMEQVSGMAWLTGFPDGPPLVPRGPCDPIGGLHAAFATLAAIIERDRTGLGQVVEVPLVEPALNVAAEQFVNYAAYGYLAQRTGNRSVSHAPHDVFRCAGDDSWVAIAVTTDEQWRTLRSLIGEPWATAPEYLTAAGRLGHQDEIGTRLAAWCAARSPESISELLWPAGVPAAPVVLPHAVVDLPQLVARGFWQEVSHPVLGRLRLPGFPAQFARAGTAFHGAPAPTLGQHNEDILVGLLGLGEAELAGLAGRHTIGTSPLGAGA